MIYTVGVNDTSCSVIKGQNDVRVFIFLTKTIVMCNVNSIKPIKLESFIWYMHSLRENGFELDRKTRVVHYSLAMACESWQAERAHSEKHIKPTS